MNEAQRPFSFADWMNQIQRELRRQDIEFQDLAAQVGEVSDASEPAPSQGTDIHLAEMVGVRV